ncbi:MAG: alpha/beta hydrolase [Acidobacteriaceae bacterium]|nr:alpha/beta hydrolase [Acidobacteriaceae bacterium]
MKWSLLLCVLAMSLAGPGRAADPPSNTVIPLWPSGAPDARTDLGPEIDTTTPADGVTGGRRVTRLSNVTAPSLTLYRPAQPNPTRSAVVVFPGGGYRILAIDLEGTEICDWLNSVGITAVLLKYRVPESPNVPRYQAPLQDAQRALGIVRSHAADWNLDPQRIGILGFSAGGHLAATLNQHFAERTYPRVDNADDLNCRPDFTVLVYPAYLSVEDKGEQIAPEVAPTSGMPPLFIVQAEDDRSFIQGTLLYYRSLVAAKAPAELHIYETGGHGYGLRPADAPVTGWPHLVEAWLRLHHLIQ